MFLASLTALFLLSLGAAAGNQPSTSVESLSPAAQAINGPAGLEQGRPLWAAHTTFKWGMGFKGGCILKAVEPGAC